MVFNRYWCQIRTLSPLSDFCVTPRLPLLQTERLPVHPHSLLRRRRLQLWRAKGYQVLDVPYSVSNVNTDPGHRELYGDVGLSPHN